MPNRWGKLTCKEAHRVLVSRMDRELSTGERLRLHALLASNGGIAQRHAPAGPG